MTSSIQIQTFDTDVHDCIILCQGPYPENSYPNILESIQRPRESFKRRILLSQSSLSISLLIPPPYDGVFIPSQITDWSLILSYIHYVQKPALVIAEDVDDIPPVLWTKLKSIKGITFIHSISTHLVQNLRPYDCVFFAPINRLSSDYSQFVFKQLQSQYKSSYSQQEHKEIIQELGTEHAGLVWTNHDEQRSSGSLYWYEPVVPQSSEYFSKKQLSELFRLFQLQFS